MKVFFLILLHFLGMQFSLHAQEDTSFNFVPERPGMATPPDVMTVKHFQIETGGQYERTGGGALVYHGFVIPSRLFRLGLAKSFELRAQTDYLYYLLKDTVISGINTISISGKIKLIEQRKLIPSIALLLNLKLPIIKYKYFSTNIFEPSIIVLLSNVISPKLNVTYNYGLAWAGNFSSPEHFYAFCLGINLNEKISYFIEPYGTFGRSSDLQFYTDTGLSYLISERFQLDISTGVSINTFPNYFFINAGFVRIF
jgi:hypothetical protein